VALYRSLSPAAQERLLVERFRTSTDWKKTTAFAIPALFTSFMRVNLRDREPLGIVTPGKEYETLLDRLEEDLHQLIDPLADAPAVRRVVRTSTLFGHHPPPVLPDLFVGWRPVPYFLEQVVHPRATLIQQKPDYFRGSFLPPQGRLYGDRGT
jgi:predicted AlkP superfamily phosphohydrolase/phosphomutase